MAPLLFLAQIVPNETVIPFPKQDLPYIFEIGSYIRMKTGIQPSPVFPFIK